MRNVPLSAEFLPVALSATSAAARSAARAFLAPAGPAPGEVVVTGDGGTPAIGGVRFIAGDPKREARTEDGLTRVESDD